MRLFDVIRSAKKNVKIHGWSSGKIPASAFPVIRNGRLQAGKEWSWRLVEFDATSHHFRVLIRLNTAKSIYAAILAMDSAKGLLVISHHELHISHRGWHCHLVQKEIDAIFPGVLRDRDLMSVYPSISKAVSVPFIVDRQSALTIAAERYRFAAQGELV